MRDDARVLISDCDLPPVWRDAGATDGAAADPSGFHAKTDGLSLSALSMAAFDAAGLVDELVHEAGHDSNYLCVVSMDRIVKIGAKPSTRAVGDSIDSALAEAINGLDKTELIRRRGPWRTIEQVERATLEYMWWWNHSRLHSELGYRTPLEVEAAHHAGQEPPQPATAGQGTP